MTMRKGLRNLSRIGFTWLLALLVAGSLLLPTAFAKDDEKQAEGLSDLSLYSRASELTREFGTKLAPGSKSDLGMIKGQDGDDIRINAGNAGGFLGYADILSDDNGVLGWLMSSYTASSATITYDQLKNVIPSNSTLNAAQSNPFYQYAGYGEALTQMGLVSTLRIGSFNDIGRTIGSAFMIFSFLLANIAPFLFSTGMFILDALNPFKFFGEIISGVGDSELGMLSGIADYVSELYKVVQNLSIVVLLPAFLILTFLSMLLMKKGNALQKFGRYSLRVFMLFAGLPLIGATYTGVVDDLKAKVDVGSDYANYLVVSSYVDFEGWVKTTRLQPINSAYIQNPRISGGEISETMNLSDRSIVLAINGSRAGNATAEKLATRYGATNQINDIFKEGGGKKSTAKQTKTTDAQESSFRSTFALLTRHMSSGVYSGAQYDGEVAGQIQKIRAQANKTSDEDIVKMFSLTASDNRTWKDKWAFSSEEAKWMGKIDWDESEGLFTHDGSTNDLFQFGDYNYNIYNGGTLTSSGATFDTDMTVTPKKGGLQPIGSSASGVVGGLSPLAMYNFLNTTFSDTGLTVYSPAKSSSDIVRDSYASVSFAGAGVPMFMRWLENFVVMTSLALLSIAYGAMLIMAAVKNIPRILSGVFGTALGSIAYATKLLISTAVMIIQILGMVFLYTLSENIIMTLLLNFNSMTTEVSDYFRTGSIAFEFARGFLTIIVTVVISLFLVKNMQVFREMLEEVTTTLINRVMGVLDTSTGGQGLDIAKTSGGRVGGDGKLTDKARNEDGGGLMGGALKAMNDAHALESQKGRLAEERGLGGRSLGEGLKARAKTASELMAAGGRDKAKGLVGIDGKSYDRELAAQQEAVKSMAHGDATALGKSTTDEYNKANEDVDVTKSGQQLDADGEVIQDAEGNAYNAQGEPISPASPVARSGFSASTDADGNLLGTDGNVYTDEAGNAFKRDEKGHLVDSEGNYVALDKDGVLQPIGMIPGHNGKPVSALREAGKLDKTRHNADAYAKMKKEQAAPHHGINEEGLPVDAKGNELMANTKDGRVPVTFDKDGFLTDAKGNKVTVAQLAKQVDDRAYEAVTDPETGEQHVKHRGDEAMKAGLSTVGLATDSASTLAKKSNTANTQAEKARERVAELKKNGASPYAIAQAERTASKAEQVATATQQTFDKAMAQNGNQNGSARVTQEEVTTAKRGVEVAKQALATDVAKLSEMQAASAPPKELAKQQQRVAARQQDVIATAARAQDTETAKKSGRPVAEITQARGQVERSEAVLAARQATLMNAVASNAPVETVQKMEKQVEQASANLVATQSKMREVSEAPRGSRQEIEKATAKVTKAKQQAAVAKQTVARLKEDGAPPQAVAQAEKVERKTSRALKQAKQAERTLKKPVNPIRHIGPVATASVTPTKSYGALTKLGVTDYANYGQQVGALAQEIETNKAAQHQVAQRIKSLKQQGRPPQTIRQAQEKLAGLKVTGEQATQTLATLKTNAQGLLKSNPFQPSVASRPIQKDGGMILNKMVELHQTQRIVEKMRSEQKNGLLTPEKQATLKTLVKRSGGMTRELKSYGIKEDVLTSSQSLGEGVRHMKQSWDAFTNGTSREGVGNQETAATQETPRQPRNRRRK